MQNILTRILPIVLIIAVSGGFMYFKFFKSSISNKDKTCTLEVTSNSSGTDEFGNPVGSGKGETKSYTVKVGDTFYENFFDLFPGEDMDKKDEFAEKVFVVQKIDDDGVTILLKNENKVVEFDKVFSVYSSLVLLDGPTKSYLLKFLK